MKRASAGHFSVALNTDRIWPVQSQYFSTERNVYLREHTENLCSGVSVINLKLRRGKSNLSFMFQPKKETAAFLIKSSTSSQQPLVGPTVHPRRKRLPAPTWWWEKVSTPFTVWHHLRECLPGFLSFFFKRTMKRENSKPSLPHTDTLNLLISQQERGE